MKILLTIKYRKNLSIYIKKINFLNHAFATILKGQGVVKNGICNSVFNWDLCNDCGNARWWWGTN